MTAVVIHCLYVCTGEDTYKILAHEFNEGWCNKNCVLFSGIVSIKIKKNLTSLMIHNKV